MLVSRGADVDCHTKPKHFMEMVATGWSYDNPLEI